MGRYAFLLLVVISTKAFSQDSSYLPMANQVLTALKLNDISKLEKFYFGAKEIDTVIFYLSKEGYTSNQIREVLNQRKTKFKTDFTEVRAETRVDWKSISLVEAKLFLGGSRPEQRTVTLGKLQIHFKDSKNEHFVVTLDECVYLNDSWWLEAEWMRLKTYDVAEPGEVDGPTVTNEENPVPVESRDNQSNLQDTLVWYNDLRKGFDIAREKGKYAMVYYQPSPCTICTYSVAKLLNLLKNYYGSFDIKGFNEKYALIIIETADTAILKNAGIKQFPGAAVFTSNRQLLHYKYNMELDKLLLYFTYSYDFGNILENIEMQNFVNYGQDAVISSGFDRKIVLDYLATYQSNQNTIRDLNRAEEELERWRNPPPPMIMDTAALLFDSTMVFTPASDYPTKENKKKKKEKNNTVEPPVDVMAPPVVDSTILPVYEEPAWTPDTTASSFNFRLDTTFLIRALDSLASKTNYPDSLTAVTIMNIYSLTDEYYCPFFVSKYLSTNDTAFVPSVSMEYLVSHYASLNKMKLATDDYNSHFYNVYEVISKRLNRFVRYNETGDTNAIRSALKYQQAFLAMVPQLEQMEKPLFITNLLQYSNVLNIDSLFYQTAKPFFDKLVLAKPNIKAYINVQSAAIGKKYEREMDYVVWNNSAETPGYKTNNGYKYYYPVYLTDKYAYILNGAAWYLYEQKTDTVSRKLAAKYVDLALQLAPQNPYYLDTRAHLQYVSGSKAAAILTQQKAVSEAVKMRKDYLLEDKQVEMFKLELEKMKSGKL